MKKLVLLVTVFIAGSANAGLLDGLTKVLGTTGNVLNTMSGKPNSSNGQSIQTPSTSKTNLIRIPDKETSEYKFENITVDFSGLLGHPAAYVTGVFYNKTDKPFSRVTMTIPTYNGEGFDDMPINITPMASAHGKTKIQQVIDLRFPDSRPDLNKIKYIPLKY